MKGFTAESQGILAAEAECFNNQCDCFVTKRIGPRVFGLKEVRIQLRVVNARRQKWRCVCDPKTQHGQSEGSRERFGYDRRSFGESRISTTFEESQEQQVEQILCSLKFVIQREREEHSNS